MVYGAFLLNGKASLDDPWIYAGFFFLVMAVAAVLKFRVNAKTKGMAIPGFNPLKWLIVAEIPRPTG